MSTLFAYQAQVKALILEGKSIILQAPTGAGKTRAALAPFIDNYWDDSAENFPKKCIYAVPMRVLANQFYGEYGELSQRFQRLHKRKFAARPLEPKRQTGEFREDPYFSSPLTFATIDQLLSSWLMHPYSLSGREGNLNAGALVGSYLIFDEFHLFDPDSTLPTTLHLLKMLKGIAPFVLMTATFSAEMLSQLAEMLDATAVLLSNEPTAAAKNIIHISPDDIPAQRKTRYYHTAPDPLVWRDENKQWHTNADAIHAILGQHQTQVGQQRTLVVVNQVDRAQRIYDALDAAKPDAVQLRLLHSRFRQTDRKQHEDEVQREFGKAEGARQHDSMIVVATQVVEVGLDMSAQTLHTELAPASAVLQRAGRCARREGETGHIYVYPTDTPMPYRGVFAQQQCALTLEWLQAHQGQHLDFAKEQQLINFAHGETDRQILEGITGTAFTHKEAIEHLWQGEGSRGDAARLIRDINSVSLVVHSDPDQLLHAPFKAESFSLHPGTVQGVFERWELAKEDSLEQDGLAWTVCYLEEQEVDEEAAQANRQIRYRWVPVRDKSQLAKPLLAVNPALVSYSAERGLTLYPTADSAYECDVPELGHSADYSPYTYKLESYAAHIEHVHVAFKNDWAATIAAVGQMLETRYSWRSGAVLEAAHLTILLHDVGKLREGWQTWAQKYQHAIGDTLPADFVAAHMLSQTLAHKDVEKGIRPKRPHHAVESAIASYNIFLARFKECEPLRRAAFTAICRHHTPNAKTVETYQLIETCDAQIAATFQQLAQPFTPKPAIPALAATGRVQDKISEQFLIRPNQPADMACYMLFVRALRFSDQSGTAAGAK